MQRIENSAIYCRPGFKPARVVIGKHGVGYDADNTLVNELRAALALAKGE